jgi:hypothetical protein
MNNMAHCDAAPVPAPQTVPRVGWQLTDGQTTAIRGRASSAGSDHAPGEYRRSEGGDVTAELEAILAVGRALARLPDSDGRRRVLNWALERFAVEADANVDVAVASAAPDAAMIAEGLADLFEGSVSPLRMSEGLDDPLDDIFDLTAIAQYVAHYDETPSASPARVQARFAVLVRDLVSAVRRFASGVRSPDAVSAQMP